MNKIEEHNVRDVYNNIAKEFSDTRQYAWPIVKDFVNNIEQYNLVCDVGSGNGKNMFRTDLMYIATDFSEEMCKLSKRKSDTVQSNVLSLPFRDQTFDAVMCIACIHHLSTDERRYNSIKECLRILKPNGKLLISVWSNSKKYGDGDQYIKWNNNETKRFYHLYSKEECKNLCEEFNLNLKYDKYNFYFYL